MTHSSDKTASILHLNDSPDSLTPDLSAHYNTIKNRLDAYFKSGATQSHSWRVRQLKGMFNLLENEQKHIEEALYKDLHKSAEEAYLTEIGFLKKEINHSIKCLKKWMKPKAVSSPMLMWPSKSLIRPEPLGTCLVIGAWNYPLQLCLGPLLAAISAGNCAILKPSELAPNTSKILADLIPEYLDTNAYAVVEGGKGETSELLNLSFDHIFYTGGERVAKVVMQAASQNLTPCTLELGGKSPCIVDNDVDLTTTIKRIVWAKWMNAGQTCVAPDYLLVHQSQLDNVVSELKRVIVKQYKKSPQKNRFYGRIINCAHCQRLAQYLDNQNVIYGGKYDVEQRFIEPTIVLNPEFDSTLMNEEIFGPLLPILTFNSKKDMLEFVRARPKPLAAYVFTQDEDFKRKCIERISAGSLCLNDTSIFLANSGLPFGGIGQSGMGRYHGKFGFDTFSHQKAILKRGFRFDHPIRYMPMNRFKMAVAKRFLK